MHDLLSLVSSAVSAGVQDYIRGINPDQDRVKQADARRYLKSRGIQPVMLRKWCDAGLLHPTKTMIIFVISNNHKSTKFALNTFEWFKKVF